MQNKQDAEKKYDDKNVHFNLILIQFYLGTSSTIYLTKLIDKTLNKPLTEVRVFQK